MKKSLFALFVIILTLAVVSPAFAGEVKIVKNRANTRAIAVSTYDKPVHLFICVWESSRNNRYVPSPCDRSYDMKEGDYDMESTTVEGLMTPEGWRKLSHQQHFEIPPRGSVYIPGCSGQSNKQWGCRWDKNTFAFSEANWKAMKVVLKKYNPDWHE